VKGRAIVGEREFPVRHALLCTVSRGRQLSVVSSQL
jgi:hypothetical protein